MAICAAFNCHIGELVQDGQLAPFGKASSHGEAWHSKGCVADVKRTSI